MPRCLHCLRHSLRLFPRLQGVFTPEDCFPEFVTDGDQPTSLPWDYIPMNRTFLSASASANTTLACQAACKASTACQYYEFQPHALSAEQCLLRLASGPILKLASFEPATSVDAILFEVRPDCATQLFTPAALWLDGSASLTMPPKARRPADPSYMHWLVRALHPHQLAQRAASAGAPPRSQVWEGQYAVYAAINSTDAHGIGVTLATGLSWSAATSYCAKTSACIGIAVGATANSYRAFAGALAEGVVGKIRVVGETINSWIPDGEVAASSAGGGSSGAGAPTTAPATSPAAATWQICTSGSYWSTAASSCTACPKPVDFTGTMVSRVVGAKGRLPGQGVCGASQRQPYLPALGSALQAARSKSSWPLIDEGRYHPTLPAPHECVAAPAIASSDDTGPEQHGSVCADLCHGRRQRHTCEPGVDRNLRPVSVQS